MSVEVAHPDEAASYVGRQRVIEEVIAFEPVDRMRAILDLDVIPAPAGEVPQGWHWLYFLPAVNARAIERDGHPERGDFLPPVAQRHRMFAGARLNWFNGLLIGEKAQLVEKIASVEAKQGRTGSLVFVSVERAVLQRGVRCLSEVQTLVYHDGGGAKSQIPPDELAWEPDWRDPVSVDPVTLFRFSAVTFNAHRIHYDRDYAVNAEGYRALVVHGPLIALWLLESLRQHSGGRPLSHYRFQARKPLFDDEPFEICGRLSGNSAQLTARSSSGYTALYGNMTFSQLARSE